MAGAWPHAPDFPHISTNHLAGQDCRQKWGERGQVMVTDHSWLTYSTTHDRYPETLGVFDLVTLKRVHLQSVPPAARSEKVPVLPSASVTSLPLSFMSPSVACHIFPLLIYTSGVISQQPRVIGCRAPDTTVSGEMGWNLSSSLHVLQIMLRQPLLHGYYRCGPCCVVQRAWVKGVSECARGRCVSFSGYF